MPPPIMPPPIMPPPIIMPRPIIMLSDRVRNRGQSWIVQFQRYSGNLLYTSNELGAQVVFAQVQYLRREHGAIVVYNNNCHTIGERTDVKLLQKSSFGVTNLITFLGKKNVIDDFNLTLLNLGWNLKSLEERGLTWITTGWTLWYYNINRGDGANTGRSRYTVRFQSF